MADLAAQVMKLNATFERVEALMEGVNQRLTRIEARAFTSGPIELSALAENESVATLTPEQAERLIEKIDGLSAQLATQADASRPAPIADPDDSGGPAESTWAAVETEPVTASVTEPEAAEAKTEGKRGRK